MKQGPRGPNTIECHDLMAADGQEVRVSTIRCIPGGADPNKRSSNPFNPTVMGDHETFDIWPFESMVFPVDSSIGLHHQPHATEAEAREYHERLLLFVSKADFWKGQGVDGLGLPTTTRAQWESTHPKAKEPTVERSDGFWAIVELPSDQGSHVRMAGYLTEEERFGSKLGRLDIPRKPDPACAICKGTGKIPREASREADQPIIVSKPGDSRNAPCPMSCCTGLTTTYFGGQSVYRITPCTEDVARTVAVSSQPEPVHPYEMTMLAPPRPAYDRDEEDL